MNIAEVAPGSNGALNGPATTAAASPAIGFRAALDQAMNASGDTGQPGATTPTDLAAKGAAPLRSALNPLIEAQTLATPPAVVPTARPNAPEPPTQADAAPSPGKAETKIAPPATDPARPLPLPIPPAIAENAMASKPRESAAVRRASVAPHDNAAPNDGSGVSSAQPPAAAATTPPVAPALALAPPVVQTALPLQSGSASTAQEAGGTVTGAASPAHAMPGDAADAPAAPRAREDPLRPPIAGNAPQLAPPEFRLPAAASPASASAASEPVVSARHGEIGQALGIEIAHRVTAGGSELRVRLNPESLGRVEVGISFDTNGSLRATVRAENPAALTLLRNDQANLNQTLNDAGIRADAQSFRFESSTGGGQPQHQPRPSPASTIQPIDEASADPTPLAAYRAVRTPGRVDLFA